MLRPASHAGSWYDSTPAVLKTQVANWLDEATAAPARGRFGVGPHAGYRFCGHVLANTYANIDRAVTRVVIMGPSHFEYFRGLRTTAFGSFATPLGNLDVDVDTVQRLHAAGVEFLTEQTDVKEHSWEMHLPFLKSVAPRAQVVPLLFGASSSSRGSIGDETFDLLLSLVSDPKTAFVVSTDFCHWGKYFAYTPFVDKAPLIYKAIEALDREGMQIASKGSASAWRQYIQSTGNTVCGEKPLGLLLQLREASGTPLELEWLAYDQSSKTKSHKDSSVSYAAAVAQ